LKRGLADLIEEREGTDKRIVQKALEWKKGRKCKRKNWHSASHFYIFVGAFQFSYSIWNRFPKP